MKRYFFLFLSFWKNSLMRDFEYRANVLIWTILNFMWFGVIWFGTGLILGQVNDIAGWTKNEVLLLVIIQQIFIDVLWTFVLQNMNNMSDSIRRGRFDYILLKPINPRFYISTRYIESDHYVRIVALVIFLIKFVSEQGLSLSLTSWLGFMLIFALGVFIFYNLFFLITTTNFWFTNLFNLTELFGEIIDIGKYPVYIFRKMTLVIFLYIVPIAFIATYPAQILLGKADISIYITAILIAGGLFIFSEWFWNFALRHYSSASS